MNSLHLNKLVKTNAPSFRTTLCACALLSVLGPMAAVKVPAATPASAGAAEGPGLALTPAQKAQSNAYQAKMRQDVEALSANKKMTPEEKQAELQKLEKQYDADMLSVLTPAQRTLVEKKRASVNARFDELKARSLKLQKTLTPQQQKKIAAIMQNAQESAQSILKDEKKSKATQLSELTHLKDKANAQTLAILNPSQRVEYNKMAQIQREIAADQQWGATTGQ